MTEDPTWDTVPRSAFRAERARADAAEAELARFRLLLAETVGWLTDRDATHGVVPFSLLTRIAAALEEKLS